MGTEGLTGKLLSDTVAPDYGKQFEIPDMLAYIQGKTELTRTTILDIVKKSDKISELLINPQMFMDNTTNTIKNVLYDETFTILSSRGPGGETHTKRRGRKGWRLVSASAETEHCRPAPGYLASTR